MPLLRDGRSLVLVMAVARLNGPIRFVADGHLYLSIPSNLLTTGPESNRMPFSSTHFCAAALGVVRFDGRLSRRVGDRLRSGVFAARYRHAAV